MKIVDMIHKKMLITVLPLLATIILAGCAGASKTSEPKQPMNQEVTSLTGEPILLGPINLEGLGKEPYREWFTKEYNEYRPDVITLDGIKNEVKNSEVLIFMGTWCEDTQRELPRFFKILEHVGYRFNRVDMIAVDDHPDRYKQSPQREDETWNIETIPTFILLQDGKEIGRIAEYPEDTLERDLKKMLVE